MRPLRRIAAVLLLAGALGPPAPASATASSIQVAPAAQTPAGDAAYHTATEPDVPEKQGRVLRALWLDGPPPVLDGVLDDPVWARADSAGDLLQWEPDNMAPMSERTVVRVAYDARYLYVAVQLYDRTPADIVRGLGRRDQPPPSDRIEIGLDTQHDHLTGYVFGTNPSAVQQETWFYDDTFQDRDYNAVWDVRTRVTELGWSAEFQIPFSQMRFQAPPTGRVVWGFDVRRTIQRRNETGQWVGRPRGEQGQVSRWGHLVFEEGLSTPRRIEALPFALARGDAPAEEALTDGYDVGLDLRTGLGRSATLAATFNPDFGQVEADPAVLNLSVFETFFPEKRPFFLSDGSLFVPAYGLFQLFHSRRIGRRPGYFSPVRGGDVVLDRPEQTTILGAAKVTGKSGGTTYGLLSALTSAEHALVEATTAAGERERLARTLEPTTSWGAARVQQDLGSGSNVGLLATGVVRDRAPDAFTGGFDYRLRWGRNRWQASGHWAVSHAPLDTEHVRGAGGVANLSFDGTRWGLNAHLDHFSRDFRIGDLGFLRTRADRTAWNGQLRYGNPDPGPVLRSWNVSASAGEARNGSGLRLERWYGAFAYAQLPSFWGFNLGVNRAAESFDDLDTRGGPPILDPPSTNVFLGLNSDPRKSWSLFVFGNLNRDAAGGRSWSVGPNLQLRPSPRLQLSTSGNLSSTLDPAQWIANEDTDGDGTDDHVYGELESRVLSLTLRASAAVNRDLTLEAFLQPFVAVGDYTGLKRLARPRSFAFDPLPDDAVDDPDFNTRSLRGTVVLRWEYLPGSTVFVVWNLQGADASRPGIFDPLRDLGDVFGAPLDHRFMVKANYWLAL